MAVSNRSKYYKSKRLSKKKSDDDNRINPRLLIALILLLLVLLMEKYQVQLGSFNVDTIYQSIYYNEDIDKLKNTVLLIDNDSLINNSEVR